MVEDDNYYHNGAYTIHVEDGQVNRLSGPHAQTGRAKAQRDLMESFVPWLPDLNITTWLHDTPVIHTAGETKARYVELARQHQSARIGLVYQSPVDAYAALPRPEWEDPFDRADYVGWEAFCPPDSNLRKAMGGLDAGDPPLGRSFIVDHVSAMEICRHPHLLNLHSLTSNYGCAAKLSHNLPH
jgi:hypothetical protein